MPQRRPAPVTIATLFSPLIVTFSSGEARKHRNATQGLGKVSSAPSAAAQIRIALAPLVDCPRAAIAG